MTFAPFRILGVACVALFVVTFVGCGQPSSEPTGTTAEAQKKADAGKAHSAHDGDADDDDDAAAEADDDANEQDDDGDGGAETPHDGGRTHH